MKRIVFIILLSLIVTLPLSGCSEINEMIEWLYGAISPDSAGEEGIGQGPRANE